MALSSIAHANAQIERSGSKDGSSISIILGSITELAPMLPAAAGHRTLWPASAFRVPASPDNRKLAGGHFLRDDVARRRRT